MTKPDDTLGLLAACRVALFGETAVCIVRGLAGGDISLLLVLLLATGCIYLMLALERHLGAQRRYRHLATQLALVAAEARPTPNPLGDERRRPRAHCYWPPHLERRKWSQQAA